MAESKLSPLPKERYPVLPRLKISMAGKINEKGPAYTCSSLAAAHAKKMRRLDREEFWAIHLNVKNRMVGYEVISTGSLSSSIIHPREVFKGALLNNASAIICCHNHPSGEPRPSREDKDITVRLKMAGDLLGVRVLDHLIIGHQGYFSFADAGVL